MTTFRRASLFMLGVLVLACAMERPRTAESLAGCYAIVRRDGNAEPLGIQLPDTLRLDSAVHRNPDGRPYPTFPLVVTLLAHRPRAGQDSLRLDRDHTVPWPPDWPNHFALTVWRFAKPDSVGILLHANMDQSWHLQLVAIGDSLVGSAEEYSDVINGHPIIPVAAHRAPCGSSPHVAI